MTISGDQQGADLSLSVGISWSSGFLFSSNAAQGMSAAADGVGREVGPGVGVFSRNCIGILLGGLERWVSG